MSNVIEGGGPVTPALRATGVSKAYGGTQALDNVTFQVRPGEVHGLVGENGAGKSTMVKILAGAIVPDAGELTMAGEVIRLRNPRDAISHGIAVVHQELSIAPHLTVSENIALGQLPSRAGLVRSRAMNQVAEAVLKELGISLDPKAIAGSLSIGAQQLVEIARALTRDVKILLLDEPSAVLGYEDLDRLYSVIRRLRDRGVAIVYISHRLPELFRLTDRMTVFRDGKFIATTSTSDLDEETLIHQMTGRNIGGRSRAEERLHGDLLLAASGIEVRNRVFGADLSIHGGEILCLTGLVGAGRTETIRAITGADRSKVRELVFENQTITKRSPRLSRKLGIGYLPESRRSEGLLANRSVLENISVASMDASGRHHWGVIKRKKELSEATRLVKALEIKIQDVYQAVGDLSGGNQQKVLIARWLLANPKLYIFDEPTRGIDIGAKAEIYKIILQLADEGKAVLVVSSEVEEVVRIADRVLVMRDGKIVSSLVGGRITDEAITRAQLQTDSVAEG